MTRSRIIATVLAVSLGVSLTGCRSARVITKDESGGVIAIPANTDAWPFRFRSKANELLAQQCPEGYEIVREEEVITGQQTVVNEEERNRTQQINKRASLSVGSTTTTETTSDITEWRIHYRKKTAEDTDESDESESIDADDIHSASLEEEHETMDEPKRAAENDPDR